VRRQVTAACDGELDALLRAWRERVLPRRFGRLPHVPARWDPAVVPLGPGYWRALSAAWSAEAWSARRQA
jgi:hypothetical protein